MTPARRLRLSVILAAALALPAPAAAAAEPAVGIVASTNSLAGFDTATPGTFASLRPITGLAPGERVQGLDFRHLPAPAIEPAPLPRLFALGVTPGAVSDTLRVYTIDPGTAVATPVGTTPIPVASAGGGYGFDFNPVSDRMRVVNTLDRQLRLNPNNGALAGPDADIHPGGRQISAIAYDRVNVQPTIPATPGGTTVYAISRALSQLGRIGGIDGDPSPNFGEYFAIGGLATPLDAGTTVDFDITFGGAALATATSDGTPALFGIDLASGAATPLGATAAPLSAFAVIPTTVVAFGAPSYAAGESDGAATVTVVRGGSEPGSVSPSTSVAWSASNGPGGTVAFGPDEASKSFTVPIAADGVDEADEAVTLTLSSASFPATLGAPATATLTIADDDPAPDATAPTLRLTAVPKSIPFARLVKRGIRATVTPSEPAALAGALLGTSRKARLSAFNLTLASRSLPRAAGTRTIRLRPSRKALRRPRRTVRLRVQITATDAAGNRAVARRTVRLKR